MELNNEELDNWNNIVLSKKMDQRIKEFKKIGTPIFTYDELDNELSAALARIKELETQVFKLKKENAELRSSNTTTFSPEHNKYEMELPKENSDIHTLNPVNTQRQAEWRLDVKFKN